MEQKIKLLAIQDNEHESFTFNDADLRDLGRFLLPACNKIVVNDGKSFENGLILYKNAREGLKTVETGLKPVNDQIKEYKKRIDAFKKEVDAIVNDATADIRGAEAILKEKLINYIQIVGDSDKIKSPVEGVSIREIWSYKANGEPLDPSFTTTDEYGFIVPDHKKIKSAVSLNKDKTSIRGVDTYKTYTLVYKEE